MRELTWVANYAGGEQLKQFDNGKEHKYADINREKLERFDLIDKETGKAVHSLYLREGQQLIWRRRTLKKLDQSFIVIYLVGYKVRVLTNSGPKDLIVLNYIHPDGSVSLDGSRNNLELLPFE